MMLSARRFAAVLLVAVGLTPAAWAGVQPGVADPGLRGGALTGGPLAGLSSLELAYFTSARARFIGISSVSGTLPGETGRGLGPRFNLNSCAACHASPAAANLALRIPTPLFGLGLVENVPDGNLQAAFAAQAALKTALGITGQFNSDGNGGGITRFGWKAQIRSLLGFATGARRFFLHDGRTGDLVQAILAHDGPQSEATAVVLRFLAMSAADQQALLLFLRSL